MSDPTSPGSARFADPANRYRLDSRIATGGMGEVWRATDTVLGREVAVKLLKSEYADDPTFRSRFESEARHAASLHHPHVAAVYDVGQSGPELRGDGSGQPVPFLVMELVDGEPLSTLLRGGRTIDPVPMRDLLAQAGEAIGAAHAAGIVHRDVKPANLMVTPDRQVKITDFGIARASDGLGLTGTGQVMGTPQYLAPEQARGNAATPASDVYALGVVAWECLAGRRPFDKETAVATALAHLNDPVPPLPDDVPDDLATVVERALSKDPADRYPDGSAFAAALRDPATAAVTMPAAVPPVAAQPAGETTRVMPAVAPVPVAPPVDTGPLDEPWERDQRRRGFGAAWVFVAVLLLGALAVGLIYLASQRGDDEPAADPTPSASASASGSPSPSESPSEEPSETPSEEPETIDLDTGDYLGRDADTVAEELQDLGLRVRLEPTRNPDGEDADTVASLEPTEGLVEGETVVVRYFEEPEPTEEPSPTEGPSPTEQTTPEQPNPAGNTPGGPGNEGPGGPGGNGPGGRR